MPSTSYVMRKQGINIGKLQINDLISNLKTEYVILNNVSLVKGEPLFTTAKEILKYRKGF